MKQRPLDRYLSRLIWLGVTPLFLVAAGMATLSVMEHREDMRERAVFLVNDAVADVDNYLDARIKALGILADSSFADTPGQWHQLYELARDFHNNFGSPVLFADTGDPMQMLFNTRVPFGTALPPVPRPAGRAAAPTALETRAPAVGDTFTGPITGTTLVAIAVPMLRNGAVRHLLISPMDASEFQVRIADLELPGGWSLSLIDGTGQVIAQNPSNSPGAGQPNGSWVSVSEPIGFAPWTARIDIPEASYNALFWREVFALLITIGLAILVGVILGSAAGRPVIRQLQALALSTPGGAPSPIKEISQVQDRLEKDFRHIQESEQRHRELFEANPHPMWVYDLETLEFLEVNDAAIYQYGFSREEFLDMTIKDIRPPEDVVRLLRNVAKVTEGLNDTGSVWRHRTKGGRLLDVEIMSHFLLFKGRRAELVLAHDVTEEKRAKRLLKDHARQQLLVARLGQLALSVDSVDEVIESACEATTEGLSISFSRVVLFDFQRSAFVMTAGQGWGAGLVGLDLVDRAEIARALAVFRTSEPLAADDVMSDYRFAESDLIKSHNIISGADIMIGRADKPLGVLGAYSDSPKRFSEQDIRFLQGVANTLAAVIERHQSHEQLNYMAVHDAVTDLPNRLLMTDRLDVALHHAERSGMKVALLLIDLDRFKNVNDVFGHVLGDRLLHEVGQRLSHCVRADDTVSRQSGDEFIVVLPEIEEEQDAARIAEKIIRVVTRPFTIDGQEILLGVSVGIVCFPDNGEDSETLLRNADAAMHVAQGLGRNRYQFYSPEMNERALELIGLEGDLRFAIERDELFLVYQPQISLETGEVIGFEALVRWQHPVRGLISPAHFIPVAEESGLIVDIGNWVLKTACCQYVEWMDEGLVSGTIAVNVSAHQFRQPDFIDTVEEALIRCGLRPEHLELELTESVVMHGIEDVLCKLEELDQLGIKLAIDDFGTGYSSLSYLKQFPLFRLKIDQSFTRVLPEDLEGGAIAKAIIQMGHTLGLEVIAEGIETPEQRQFLQALACDSGQGYLFAKPLSVKECPGFLRNFRESSVKS